jgi:hypothetical protein
MKKVRGSFELRVLPAVLAVLVPLLFSGPWTEAGVPAIHVQGRILSPDGHGLAGQAVRLFKTRRSLALGKFSSGGQIAEATRTTTDEHGFYEIRIQKDRAFDDYFLRFYDLSRFDTVRYRLPEDREITKEIRRGGTLRIDMTLAWHDAWPEVESRLEDVGADSPRGRILLALGLPESEKRADGPAGPRDEWWYHSRGIVYYFKGRDAAGFRRFEPVPAAFLEKGGY